MILWYSCASLLGNTGDLSSATVGSRDSWMGTNSSSRAPSTAKHLLSAPPGRVPLPSLLMCVPRDAARHAPQSHICAAGGRRDGQQRLAVRLQNSDAFTLGKHTPPSDGAGAQVEAGDDARFGGDEGKPLLPRRVEERVLGLADLLAVPADDDSPKSNANNLLGGSRQTGSGLREFLGIGIIGGGMV